MARSKDSPYEQARMRLNERWPHCQKHNGYCYITKGGSYDGIHYPFESREWGVWATCLQKGKAVVDYPPRNPEFDEIIAAYDNKRSKRGKKKNRSHKEDSSDNESVNRIFKHLTFNLTPQQGHLSHPRRYSDPISPEKCKPKKRSIIDLLMRCGYEKDGVKDYTDALNDYIAWCKVEFPKHTFDQAYDRFHLEQMDIEDVIAVSDASTLSKTFDIPFGVARRIFENIERWLITIAMEDSDY